MEYEKRLYPRKAFSIQMHRGKIKKLNSHTRNNPKKA